MRDNDWVEFINLDEEKDIEAEDSILTSSKEDEQTEKEGEDQVYFYDNTDYNLLIYH